MKNIIRNKPLFIITVLILFLGLIMIIISYIPVPEASQYQGNRGLIGNHIRTDVFVSLRFVGILLLIPAVLVLWNLYVSDKKVFPIIILCLMALVSSFFLISHSFEYYGRGNRLVEMDQGGDLILDFDDLWDGEFVHISLIENNEEIVFEGEQGVKSRKKFFLPIDIESNRDYLISFEVKKTMDISKGLEFGFNGWIGEDEVKLYRIVEPVDIGWDYIPVKMVVNPGTLPDDAGNIYFSMVTETHGEIVVRGLRVYEAEV
jgi:hypothetical protein